MSRGNDEIGLSPGIQLARNKNAASTGSDADCLRGSLIRLHALALQQRDALPQRLGAVPCIGQVDFILRMQRDARGFVGFDRRAVAVEQRPGAGHA